MSNLSKINQAMDINAELAKLAGLIVSLDPGEGLSGPALEALQVLAGRGIVNTIKAATESTL